MLGWRAQDGSMARIPQLLPFCAEHRLVLTSIADMIAYIKETETGEA
jgi:3,4-dihydroxy 2-butanone 4-phosphate synthase/GTP cyclohydrolase II